MIIVNLKGGLGNQMFQYAAGIALAEKHHAELKLDAAFLHKSAASAVFTKRRFELEIFDLRYTTASESDVAEFTLNRNKFWYRALRRYFPAFIRKKIYHHDLLNFDPAFADLGSDVYLDGYFQSEHYFENVSDTIRSHFRFRNPPVGRNKEMAEEIMNYNSISLHVRRGDYLSEINSGIFGNICTPDYYTRAVQLMSNEVRDPRFYIFSDDVDWARENLKIESPVTYIDFNSGDNSFEDMRLMSLCRHNIIANSSFSWWGAWLNGNPSKKVIAPSKWINDPRCVVEDVIPKSWRRI